MHFRRTRSLSLSCLCVSPLIEQAWRCGRRVARGPRLDRACAAVAGCAAALLSQTTAPLCVCMYVCLSVRACERVVVKIYDRQRGRYISQIGVHTCAEHSWHHRHCDFINLCVCISLRVYVCLCVCVLVFLSVGVCVFLFVLVRIQDGAIVSRAHTPTYHVLMYPYLHGYSPCVCICINICI